MKKCVWIILLMFANSYGYTQSQEAKQLLLDVEKLAQLKNILTDLKKGYEILSGGYTAIRNISEGNFNLHELFLNSLLEVSPAVKNYKRIADIIAAQINLAREYKTALRQFKESGKFRIDEIGYISKVYSNLFNQSVQYLGDLATIITAGKLRMSDGERLSAIDGIWKETSAQLSFLRHFTNQTKILALQRGKAQNDIATMRQLYNLNQ